MRVAVLAGGGTSEHAISLDTGNAVTAALRKTGHDANLVVLAGFAALDEAVHADSIAACDAVFVALHGGAGEDGRVQAVLEMVGKPYVGSRPGPSAVAMDKSWSKQIVRDLGLPTAEWLEIDGSLSHGDLFALAGEFGYPLVFKPVHEGSAVGVYLAASEEELEAKLASAGDRHGPWMFERYIAGRELTLPVLCEEAMEIIEIRPKQGFYDYHNKYTKGATEYFCPADLPAEFAARLSLDGMAAYEALRMRDMARIDYRLAEDGTAYFLEANSIPGMTALSLLPMGAKARGIEFPEMCDRLVRAAAARGADA